MSVKSSFHDLLHRIRAGDEQAADKVVQLFEPAIRASVHRRLTNARLQPLVDSMDISQSVLKSFFIRAAAGQYELGTPNDLVKLLMRMAHNKLIDQARKHRARRRNIQRREGGSVGEREPVHPGTTPSEQVAKKELLQEIDRRLSPEERKLADLRGQGLEWGAISLQMGGTAQGRRKQLKRALTRVAAELRLDKDSQSSDPA